MSDQEINIAIAEVVGWKDLEIEDFSEYGVPCFILMGSNNTGTRLMPPDYCNDLNAMREAEELFELSAKFGAHDYAANLYHICVPRDMQHDDHFICWVVAFYLLNATARQRAEAFLRTIGRWKEEAK